MSICSPNYLHDAHIRLALRVKAHAICEKPLVINPWNLEQLVELQEEHQRRIYCVLQLRLHPAIQALKQTLEREANRSKHKVELTYITRRGRWYDASWKGSENRSGGLAMNIGIHFFDLLLWLFGPVERSVVQLSETSRMAGAIELEWASVRWFLSVDGDDLPNSVREQGGYAYRSLTLDGQPIDLSSGFADLHSEVYRDILAGGGFGIEDAKPSIDLVYTIRHCRGVVGSDMHPFAKPQRAA